MSTVTVRIILYSSTLQLLNEPLVHLHCSSCTLQAHFRSLYLNVLYNVLHTRLSQTMTTFPKFNPNRPSVTCRMHVHVPLEPSDFTECLSRQVHVYRHPLYHVFSISTLPSTVYIFCLSAEHWLGIPLSQPNSSAALFSSPFDSITQQQAPVASGLFPHQTEDFSLLTTAQISFLNNYSLHTFLLEQRVRIK